MKRLCLLGCMLLGVFSAKAQILAGKIMNKNMGLPFVNIWILGTTNGTISNEKGEFTLSIPHWNQTDSIAFASVGYETLKIAIQQIDFSNPLSVKLKEARVSLNEIAVIARKPISKEFAIQHIKQLQILQNPTSNADALKAIATLSASTNIDESASPSLRGSAANRTRITLNGVPIYNPVKFTDLDNIGVFSLFNTGLIKEEFVYASNPPLTYGGSTAGLVEIETVSQLYKNSTEISLSLANIGLMHAQQMKKSDNFFQLYGNYQYGAPMLSLNKKNSDRLNAFSSVDTGINLHFALGDYSSINLYNYVNYENSDYRANIFGYEQNSLKNKLRGLGILSYHFRRGNHTVDINYGLDYSQERLRFGNMIYQPVNKFQYASFSYKKIWKNVNYQTGWTFQHTRYNSKNSRLPVYYFALSPESPSFICDSIINGYTFEPYIAIKWNISNKWIAFGALRTNMISSDKTLFLSYQSSITYLISNDSKLLLSAGKYNGHTIPNYYLMSYSKQEAIHCAFDYSRSTAKNVLNAGIYYKIENGDYTTNYIDRSDQCNILGIEISASQKLYQWFNISAAYTYLYAKQKSNNLSFNAANSQPYIIKLAISYQNLRIGTFSFSYIARSGFWYTPITNGIFYPEAQSYYPLYGAINSKRMGPYNCIDFSANKLIVIGKHSLVIYVTINNFLNINNKRELTYTLDYSSFEYNYFNKRFIYFGVTFQI